MSKGPSTSFSRRPGRFGYSYPEEVVTTGARVQIIRRLSVSVVEATSGDDARDQTADGRIDRVFELNMGIFRF